MAGDSTSQAQTGKPLDLRLYAVVSTGLGHPERIRRELSAHLEYMIGLEKRGILFASGPFKARPGGSEGDGLTILRAGSLEQATQLAESDPFVRSGARTFEVREWTLFEGRLTVELDFSDKTCRVT